MKVNRACFATLAAGTLLFVAGGCGDSHKVPPGAPKNADEAVNIDMGGGTEANKESASESPPAETPPAETPAPPPSEGAAPAEDTAPAEKEAAKPAEGETTPETRAEK